MPLRFHCVSATRNALREEVGARPFASGLVEEVDGPGKSDRGIDPPQGSFAVPGPGPTHGPSPMEEAKIEDIPAMARLEFEGFPFRWSGEGCQHLRLPEVGCPIPVPTTRMRPGEAQLVVTGVDAEGRQVFMGDS